MGTFRIILAISVLIAHSSPIFGLNLVGGQAAVQVFYLISGFYMALILTEKYKDTKLFFLNRFQKIFFVYWAVLILTIIVGIIGQITFNHPITLTSFFNYFHKLSLPTIITLMFTNAFIFGQDILMFTGINLSSGQLYFLTDFRIVKPEIYNFLLVNQAWTVSLELAFYLLVPRLNRFKTTNLLKIVLLSISIRILLLTFGLKNDPWSYRFFPNEIGIFVLGMLAYRFYKKHQTMFTKKIIYIFPLVLIFFTLLFPHIPRNNSKIAAYVLFSLISIPFLFSLTKKSKVDRLIGELTYPLYLIHQLIIDILKTMYQPNQLFGLQVLILSLTASTLIYFFLSRPLDLIRQKRLTQAV